MYTYIFVLLTLFVFAHMLLSQPKAERTLFDPGLIVITLFSLCYLLPTAVINLVWVDSKLISQDIENRISIYGIIFIIVFSIAYKYFTRRRKKLQICGDFFIFTYSCGFYFTLYVLLTVLILLLTYLYGGLNFTEYTERYALIASMPIYILQFVNVATAMRIILSIIVISKSLRVSQDRLTWNKLRYVYGILIILIFELLLTKSRSNFVDFILLFAFAHSLFRKSIGLKKELIISLIFVNIMSIFALVRSDSFDSGSVFQLVPSEFVSIYRNAAHILSIKNTPEYIDPPGVSYIQSVISFIPKQLYSEKWDLGSWYVSTYYINFKESGGGLAFGVIPEAVVNFGVLSICIQAIIIAFFLGYSYEVAKRSNRSHPGVAIIYYLFNISLIYQCIRTQSTVFIDQLFFGFIVPLCLIFLIHSILRSSLSRHNA